MTVTPIIPAQKPPKKPLIPRSIRPFLFSILIGFCIFFALQAHQSHVDDTPPVVLGQSYLTANAKWQSYNVSWTGLDGKFALDMSVALDSFRGPERGTRIYGKLLLSLCGSILTDLPMREGISMDRSDIYRLGFRFTSAITDKLGDIYPVSVVDGACEIDKRQKYFEWNYPGILAGWRPSEFGTFPESNHKVFSVHFQRRSGTAVEIDEFDPLAACTAIVTDPPFRARRALGRTNRISIQATRGLTTPFVTLGTVFGWRYTVVGGECHLDGPKRTL